jgi:hypothetical protein
MYDDGEASPRRNDTLQLPLLTPVHPPRTKEVIHCLALEMCATWYGQAIA